MVGKLSLLLAVGLLGGSAANAATKAPVRKAPVKKMAVKPKAASSRPVAAVTPPAPVGFMVPKAVSLRKTTADEDQANAIWNIRAALNVGALQCQYSPWLQTVKNYNDMLKHHGEELVAAQQTMLGHFRRYDGARATASFDQYTTRTYNSFSTLDAQYSFCAIAGRVGREVLALPRGALGPAALKWMPQIRAALGKIPLAPALEVPELQPIALAPLPPVAADS